jgi:hypothetical protein
MGKDDKMVNFKRNFFLKETNCEYKNKTICELRTPWNVLVCTTGKGKGQPNYPNGNREKGMKHPGQAQAEPRAQSWNCRCTRGMRNVRAWVSLQI